MLIVKLRENPAQSKRMSTQTCQHLIAEGVKDLPPEALAEIAQFMHFVRRRSLQIVDTAGIILHIEGRRIGGAQSVSQAMDNGSAIPSARTTASV